MAHDTLAERGGRIAAFERQVTEFERLVSQRDAEAQALHQEIATLKAEAAAATAQWHDEKTNFHAQFATASDTLTERAGVIAAFEQQVAEFERLVSRRDAEAQALHQAIATHKDEAAAATAQWHDEKTNFHAQFATASDTLTERAGVIAAFEQQVAEFERLVSRRDAEAQALHHEITTLKDEAAVTAELWLADKASLDAQLAGLTGTSTERASRIEGFEQQVADFEQLVARREAEAKALHQEIVSLEEQAAAGEARWFAEKTSFEERLGGRERYARRTRAADRGTRRACPGIRTAGEPARSRGAGASRGDRDAQGGGRRRRRSAGSAGPPIWRPSLRAPAPISSRAPAGSAIWSPGSPSGSACCNSAKPSWRA